MQTATAVNVRFCQQMRDTKLESACQVLQLILSNEYLRMNTLLFNDVSWKIN